MSELEPTISVPEAGAHASVPEALAQAGTVVTAEDRARRRQQLAQIKQLFFNAFGYLPGEPRVQSRLDVIGSDHCRANIETICQSGSDQIGGS